MLYNKPVIVAQNAKNGPLAASCPPQNRGDSYGCNKCFRAM